MSSNKKHITNDIDYDSISNLSDINKTGDENDNLDGDGEQLKISKEFQEMVIKFVKLDDFIRKKEKEIKELKLQRKPCEDYILNYLDKVGESTIDITNGKLRKNKSETKVPLNQNIIRDAIKEKVTDPKIVEDIVTLMDTLRPTNVRTNLKRTGKRNINPIQKDADKKDTIKNN